MSVLNLAVPSPNVGYVMNFKPKLYNIILFCSTNECHGERVNETTNTACLYKRSRATRATGDYGEVGSRGSHRGIP